MKIEPREQWELLYTYMTIQDDLDSTRGMWINERCKWNDLPVRCDVLLKAKKCWPDVNERLNENDSERSLHGMLWKKLLPEIGIGLWPNSFQPFLKNIKKEPLRRKQEAYSNILRPSSIKPILSFGDGACLGVPCRGFLQGRVEWEEEKISSDPHSIGSWISRMRISGQPKVANAVRNEGPIVAVSLHREHSGGQCSICSNKLFLIYTWNKPEHEHLVQLVDLN